jgi:hypothetical protein
MTQDFERQAEAFHQALYREYYLAEAGLKEQIDIAPIYERYGHLFGEQTVRELLSSPPEGQQAYLVEWITLEYLENLVKDLTQDINNAMRKVRVEWDGQQVPYHNLRPMMANEPDMKRRHQLEELERGVTASANAERLQRLKVIHGAATDLGFENYVALCDELRALQLGRLSEQMQLLLRETQTLFLQLLEEFLTDLHVPTEAAATCDVLALFRGTKFDALFPKEELLPALRTTLAGLGVDLANQTNLEVDIEFRSLKAPRAFCTPIRIPDEIKLVTKPTGGPDDYESLFHEAGHAEHFAHIDPDLPFSFKRLGDNSVTEGYAFLLQYLLHNSDWLHQVLGAENDRDFLRFARFRKLWLLRRYASKLIYEQELHTRTEGAEGRYVSILGNGLRVAIAPENYLADTDDAFYCAQYLRAWIFEAQLRRFLEGRFGRQWYASRDAGRYLISLWSRGQERRVEELTSDMGYDGLEGKYLIAELMEMQDA